MRRIGRREGVAETWFSLSIDNVERLHCVTAKLTFTIFQLHTFANKWYKIGVRLHREASFAFTTKVLTSFKRESNTQTSTAGLREGSASSNLSLSHHTLYAKSCPLEICSKFCIILQTAPAHVAFLFNSFPSASEVTLETEKAGVHKLPLMITRVLDVWITHQLPTGTADSFPGTRNTPWRPQIMCLHWGSFEPETVKVSFACARHNFGMCWWSAGRKARVHQVWACHATILPP